MPRHWIQDPSKRLHRRLDLNGDGTGTKDLVGNYSGGAVYAHIECPADADFPYVLWRMIAAVGDTNGVTAEEYGNLGSPLSNGIEMVCRDPNGVDILDMTDGFPITSNAEWGVPTYDVDLKTWGSGNELLLARWTFANFGTPLILPPGYSFGLVLNDDFSGLVRHFFTVQGFIANEQTFK